MALAETWRHREREEDVVTETGGLPIRLTGVNKAFGGVYKVRLKAKALRERSVVAYQVIKWGLVVAVIAGIWAI